MTPVEWAAILALVGGAVDLAIKVARALTAAGCTVEGCPHDLKPKPADIPAEDEAMFRARSEADARVRGLDRASIRARAGWPDGAADLAEYSAGIDDADTDEGSS